ncbi:MAG: ABC transporter transmembrane domain-containing protein, partial [Eubacteriales bacterium]|nr:ABC transporter transmembrane domain-containing protein [Eubacteriales bacterium]
MFCCMAKRWYMAVCIILLLLLQSLCELAMPGITADIIDVGVGQSGIPSVLADSISAEGMERLLLLMTGEERETTLAGYAKSGDVYIKNEMTSDEEEKLLEVMTPPMVAVYALSTEGADYKEVLGEDLYVPRDLDAFGILKLLPEETRLELTEAARERICEIPQSLITQAAVNFLREDMKEQGIDISSIQEQYLLKKGIRLILAALGMILAAVLASFLTVRFAASCAAELRTAVFEHVLSMEAEQAEKFSIASLTSKTMEDAEKIQQFIIIFFRSALAAALLGIGASVLGWRRDPGMGGIVFALFAIMLLCMAAFLLAAAGYSRKIQLWAEQMKRAVHEQLRGQMVIRAFGSGEREERKLEAMNRRWKQYALGRNRLISFLMPSLLLIMNGSLLFISGKSASGINEGYLQSGELIAYIQYIIMTTGAFLALAAYASVLPEGIRSFSQIAGVLDVPVCEKKKSAAGTKA